METIDWSKKIVLDERTYTTDYDTITTTTTTPVAWTTWSSPTVTVSGSSRPVRVVYEGDIADSNDDSWVSFSKLKELLEKSERHVDQLEEDIQYLNDKVTKLEQECLRLSAEQMDTNNSCSTLEHQVVSLDDKLESHEDRFNSMSSMAHYTLDELNKLRIRVDDLEEEVED